MTTAVEAATSVRAEADRGPDTAAIVRLGLREARRMLTHPAWLAVLAYFLLTGSADVLHGSTLLHDRKARAELLGMFLVLVTPVIMLFPANLVASSGRRSGADSMLDATPLSRTARAVGCCVAVAVSSLMGVAAAILMAIESRPRGADPSSLDGLGLAQFASVPLLYLGAGLLGVAAARWLPWPGMAFAVFVVLVFWTARGGQADSPIQASIPWIYGGEQGWIGSASYALSHAWHGVYLFGLCLLAATAATLRDRPRVMVAAGSVLAAGTFVAGLAQLP